MKRLILILLCLPLFVFSQEERKYERTMSFSQFAKELKEAADNGIGYTLESCYITYDLIKDIEYIPEGDGLYRNSERWWIYDDGDRVLRNIYFKENTKVNIRNCQFGTYNKERYGGPVLIFEECTFSEFDLFNVDVQAIILNKSKMNYFRYYCSSSAEFKNRGLHFRSRDSEIKSLSLHGTNSTESSINFIGNTLNSATKTTYTCMEILGLVEKSSNPAPR